MREPRLRKTRDLTLDMLAHMSDTWTDETAALMTMTVALVLRELNRTEVSLRLKDIEKIMEEYNITKTYRKVGEDDHLDITLTRKSLPAPPSSIEYPEGDVS